MAITNQDLFQSLIVLQKGVKYQTVPNKILIKISLSNH